MESVVCKTLKELSRYRTQFKHFINVLDIVLIKIYAHDLSYKSKHQSSLKWMHYFICSFSALLWVSVNILLR